MGQLGQIKEFLDIYSDEGEKIGQMEKKEFHEKLRKEFLEKGSASVRHKHVRLLLLNSKGRLILQRRSKWKGDNAGLWDKTIGGHVSTDEDYDLTMLKECSQELGIPSTIVSEREFDGAVRSTNLHILAILKRVTYLDNFKSKRVDQDGKTWVEPGLSVFYVGYYDGPIQFVDGESCGLQLFSPAEINAEIRKDPDKFTDDIKYMLEKFRSILKPVKNKFALVLSD
jgi:isopentenyldiphosphate isomerase